MNTWKERPDAFGGRGKGTKQKIGHKANRWAVPKMGKHARVSKQWGKSTRVTDAIDYELPGTGKIANFLSGTHAEDKIGQGIRQAAQTVKQNLESSR